MRNYWLLVLGFDLNWNDRRLRRMFHCFYLAIFKLMSGKLQAFAYNLRMIWSSCMKFWQQLRLISCMFVPNFGAIDH